MYSDNKKFIEILSSAWSIYTKSFWHVVILVLLTFVPIFMFRLFLPAHFFADFQDFSAALSAFAAGNGAMPTLQLTDGAFIYLAMFFGIGFVFYPILVAGSVYLVATHLEDKKPNLDIMFSLIFPKFPRLIATTIILAAILFFMVVLLGGFLNGILLFVPIAIALNYVFFLHVTADTGRWGLNALSLSRFLVRGIGLKVFIVTLISVVVFIFLTVATAYLSSSFTSYVVRLPIFILTHAVLAFLPVMFSVWYFSQKQARMANLKEMEKMLFDTLNEAMKTMKDHHPGNPNNNHPIEGEFEEKEATDEPQEKEDEK